jgi:hypothetical protein
VAWSGIYWPQVCRRSHATGTLLVAMAALVCWLIIPQIPVYFAGIGMPHPIYFYWIVSLVTFFVIAIVDKKNINFIRNIL